MDQYPELRLFLYSPASQAIDFAAAAFPSLRPEPKLVDEAPMTQYTLPGQLTTGAGNGVSGALISASLLLIGLGASVSVFALRFALPRRRRL
jgi:nitrous oxidase accessory protein